MIYSFHLNADNNFNILSLLRKIPHQFIHYPHQTQQHSRNSKPWRFQFKIFIPFSAKPGKKQKRAYHLQSKATVFKKRA